MGVLETGAPPLVSSRPTSGSGRNRRSTSQGEHLRRVGRSAVPGRLRLKSQLCTEKAEAAKGLKHPERFLDTGGGARARDRDMAVASFHPACADLEICQRQRGKQREKDCQQVSDWRAGKGPTQCHGGTIKDLQTHPAAQGQNLQLLFSSWLSRQPYTLQSRASHESLRVRGRFSDARYAM